MSITAKPISASEPASHLVPSTAGCAAIQTTALPQVPAPAPAPEPAPAASGISPGCPASIGAAVQLCRTLPDLGQRHPADILGPLTTGVLRQ